MFGHRWLWVCAVLLAGHQYTDTEQIRSPPPGVMEDQVEVSTLKLFSVTLLFWFEDPLLIHCHLLIIQRELAKGYFDCSLHIRINCTVQCIYDSSSTGKGLVCNPRVAYHLMSVVVPVDIVTGLFWSDWIHSRPLSCCLLVVIRLNFQFKHFPGSTARLLQEEENNDCGKWNSTTPDRHHWHCVSFQF